MAVRAIIIMLSNVEHSGMSDPGVSAGGSRVPKVLEPVVSAKWVAGRRRPGSMRTSGALSLAVVAGCTSEARDAVPAAKAAIRTAAQHIHLMFMRHLE